MSEASRRAWFNGGIVEREDGAPSVASVSFHLGIGVFDGMIAYWNRDHYYVHRAEAHLVRFRCGAAKMGMMIPWSVDELLSGIEALLKIEPERTQYVRPIAYHRGPELWVTGAKGRPVDVCIFTVPVMRDLDGLISCHISPVERISSKSIPAQTKVSGAYVNSYHARDIAERNGFDDGIMLDRRGFLAEASAANVFLARDECLITPRLTEDIFPGITRQVVMEVAKEAGIEVFEEDIRAADINPDDGAFLCSTLMEIRGIAKIGATDLSTTESRTFRETVKEFRKITGR
jgi:branched-chain amino acid aminotransferase